MYSMRIFSQRITYTVAALALLLVLVIPALASAAMVTERSIAVSSASRSAEAVSYDVEFKATGSAGAFAIDFCSNTPLLGQSCDAPTGFTAAGATVAAPYTADYTVNSSSSATHLVVDTTISANEVVKVQLNNINNPTVAGQLYARIVTFDTPAHAVAATPQNLADSVDQGAVVISITDSIGVSGTVLETLTFCVSGQAITDLCQTVSAPTLVLGEQTGSVVALSAGVVSEGSIYTQLSTNAANGAVVRLKSSADGCGGLLRAGDPSACDIKPAQNADILANSATALFGVKTTAAQGLSGANPTGTLQPVADSGYNNSTFALNYDDPNQATGVTSTFGDPFIDTNNSPVNAMGMQLNFGATITNDTPAGTYSADLSLIAVGKF